MSLGSWIAENKLAAGGIAAGAGFLYLSKRGGGISGSSSQDATGQLVPVAAAYDTSADTTASDQLSAATDAANAAAQAAQDATNNAGDNGDIGVGQLTTGLGQLQDAGLLPPFAATPAPSSVPQSQAAPTPQPSPAPDPAVPAPAPSPAPAPAASAPSDTEAAYRPGVNGWQTPNSIVKSKFPNAISWRDGNSGGTNANGTYMTVIVNTPGHHNQYFHYYVSGKNKGQWVALN